MITDIQYGSRTPQLGVKVIDVDDFSARPAPLCYPVITSYLWWDRTTVPLQFASSSSAALGAYKVKPIASWSAH